LKIGWILLCKYVIFEKIASIHLSLQQPPQPAPAPYPKGPNGELRRSSHLLTHRHGRRMPSAVEEHPHPTQTHLTDDHLIAGDYQNTNEDACSESDGIKC
jgi:hypothetical protein